MAQDGDEQGMHIPARRQKPVHHHQTPHHGIAQQLPHIACGGSLVHLHRPQLTNGPRQQPCRHGQQGHQQKGGAKTGYVAGHGTGVVNHQPSAKRSHRVRNGGPNGQPAEHAFEFGSALRSTACMALEGNGGASRGAPGYQCAETQNRKHRKQHRQCSPAECTHHRKPHRPPEPVPVCKPACRQGQEHL